MSKWPPRTWYSQINLFFIYMGGRILLFLAQSFHTQAIQKLQKYLTGPWGSNKNQGGKHGKSDKIFFQQYLLKTPFYIEFNFLLLFCENIFRLLLVWIFTALTCISLHHPHLGGGGKWNGEVKYILILILILILIYLEKITYI